MRHFEEPVLYEISINDGGTPICKDLGFYNICVSSISDIEVRANLNNLTIKEDLKSFSLKYRQMAIEGTLYLGNIRSTHVFGDYVSIFKNNFLKLYSTQSKNKKPKEIITQIVKQSSNLNDGFCFYCCVKDQEEIDHFLPEGKEESNISNGFFPQLSVMSYNLIPSCGTCNGKKLAKVGNSSNETFIHPYFSPFLNEQYLCCDVSFDLGIITFNYHVNIPISWSAQQKVRFDEQIKKFEVMERYCIKSRTAMKKYEYKHWVDFNLGGDEFLFHSIEREYISISRHLGLNSWEALMNKALCDSINDYVEYLEDKYDV